MRKIELAFVGKVTANPTVVATAQEDIRAGDSIEIDARTGKARRARFGDATAGAIGEQELEQS